MSGKKTMSVFVDESGNFDDIADPSRYCIVTLVFHDQADDISRQIRELDRANEDLGLDIRTFHFHSSPLIRQEGEYAAMSRRMRGRILDRMLTFVRHVEFSFCCFHADTAFANSEEQVVAQLYEDMAEHFRAHRSRFESVENVKVYYDAGQKPVSRMLDRVFAQVFPCSVRFVQGVRQDEYKLLQVADLICTIKRLELKLKDGQAMNVSEDRFFGGPRDFKRNILKPIERKEWR